MRRAAPKFNGVSSRCAGSPSSCAPPADSGPLTVALVGEGVPVVIGPVRDA
jgi:hypothetical protein